MVPELLEDVLGLVVELLLPAPLVWASTGNEVVRTTAIDAASARGVRKEFLLWYFMAPPLYLPACRIPWEEARNAAPARSRRNRAGRVTKKTAFLFPASRHFALPRRENKRQQTVRNEKTRG